MRSMDGPVVKRPRQTRFRGFKRGLGSVAVASLVLFGAVAGTSPAAGMSHGDNSPTPASLGLNGFQDGWAPVDGGVLHYVRGGSGPALVLLHGWPETWYEWRDVMPELAKTHTILAFDLPGLGQSSVPTDGGYDAASAAARIHQAVVELGFSNIAILAHDVGSLIAYPYARDFPSEVSRIAVLEAPLNGFGLENSYGASWHFLFNETAYPVPEELINDGKHVQIYLNWLFSSAQHPSAIAQSTYVTAYSDPAHLSAGFDYYRAYPANAAFNQAHAADKLTIPVLAMGAQSVFGTAVGQSFESVATDVRTVVAPDSGHWIPEENPVFLEQCADLFFGTGNTAASSPDLAGCAP